MLEVDLQWMMFDWKWNEKLNIIQKKQMNMSLNIITISNRSNIFTKISLVRRDGG